MEKVVGEIRVSFNLGLFKDLGHGRAAAELPFFVEAMLGSGQANGQINLAWWGRRILGPASTEDLDLTGSLIDGLGRSAAFSVVKGIYIVTNRGLSIVGDTITEAPFPMAAGDVLMTTNLGNGWPVEEGAAIRVSNNDLANSALYEIAIIGVS